MFVYKVLLPKTVPRKDSIKPAPRHLETAEKKPADTCKEDTTLYLPEGTVLVFNKCEYRQRKNCLDITEMNTRQSIAKSGMETVDGDGNPLLSSGMIAIKTKKGCDDNCFKHPITVRFPVRTCDGEARSAQWYAWSGGAWRIPPGKKTDIRMVKINGLPYLEAKIYCPGVYNCDCCKKMPPQIKFKAPNHYKIVKLMIRPDCPNGAYALKVKAWRKNIAKKRIPCSLTGMVAYGVIVNAQGDTMVLDNKPLAEIKHRILFPRCARYFLFIQLSKGSYYRKYLIRPDDLITMNEYRKQNQAAEAGH